MHLLASNVVVENFYATTTQKQNTSVSLTRWFPLVWMKVGGGKKGRL
ncbi:MAG: hypothetical protein QW791_07380 [Candidatus Bathyarchaeia archaeon]